LSPTVDPRFGIGQHFRTKTSARAGNLLRDRSHVNPVVAGWRSVPYFSRGISARRQYYRRERTSIVMKGRYKILSPDEFSCRRTKSGSDSSSLWADRPSFRVTRQVKIAAHAHILEIRLLACCWHSFTLRSQLGEVWKRRWAVVLLTGSLCSGLAFFWKWRYGPSGRWHRRHSEACWWIVAQLAMWIGILRLYGQI